ncbi:MAG: response regulator [Candidatus Omnitrophica bacterium]|nr:response regulator [Candidatus Omnitrophota bacterium]
MIHNKNNILLVEDNTEHSDLIQRAFKSRKDNMTQILAENVETARNVMSKMQIDLLISDLILPDGKGVDFLKFSEKESKAFPVLIITSQGDEVAAVEAMKLGAMDYIIKSPETIEDLPRISTRVMRDWDNIIRRKKAEEELKSHQDFLEKLVEERTKQLIQSERLAATGRLAASMAHEINNPLQGITTHLEIIKRFLPENFKKIKNYNIVKENVEKIGNIVKQMLDIYRNSSREKSSININNLISKVVSLVENQVRINAIDLKENLDESLPDILGWQQQLHQVILNLLLNAIDNVEQGGVIKVSTSENDKSIIIKVEDNGKGIPHEDIVHIFDAFYSEKKDAGVGLGLFVCNGLVRNHNGEIIVTSEEGKGSTFTIILPKGK